MRALSGSSPARCWCLATWNRKRPWCKQTSSPPKPTARTAEIQKCASLTRSASHSLLQVLCASTHRLGFMSFGHIPACEYRMGGKALPCRETSRSNRTLLFPSKIHIHRVNGANNISELLQGSGSDQAGGSSCLPGVACFGEP